MSGADDSSNSPAVGAYNIHDLERCLLKAGVFKVLNYAVVGGHFV
jgi:hypothetical protein